MILKAKAFSSNLQALSSSVGDLASASNAFSETETNSIDYLNALSPADLAGAGGHNSVPNVLSRCGQLLSRCLGSLAVSPDAVNILFVESLEYESSQLADFLSLAKNVDTIVRDCDRYERALTSLVRKDTAKLNEVKLQQHTQAIAAAENMQEQGKM